MSEATDEVVLYGIVSHLEQVLNLLPATPALVALEPLPAEWLDADARSGGVQFEEFASDRRIDRQSRGRIFSHLFEFRWEPYEARGATFQVRYVGTPVSLENLTPAGDFGLQDMKRRDVAYDLWGERVDNPASIGERSDALVYAELRVPRLLHYPVVGRPKHVRLRVREYIDPATGLLALSRFCGLDEEP